MLRKRPSPMIGKLSELLVSGGRIMDTTSSPRGPLDSMMQSSPRGLKNYDLGSVGLKIVAALDNNSNNKTCEVLPKHAVCTSNLNRSRPIQIQSVKNTTGFQMDYSNMNEIHMENLVEEEEEEYTYVTCHVPNKTFTKVYYDDGEVRRQQRYNNNNNNVGVVRISSPPRIFIEAEPLFPTSNFLNSCHLCGKNLHGKDIYMYRGEKGFCSTECRSSQMMMDERKERCGSEASRSVELSSSPYTRGQIFSTGILAV